MLKKAKSPTMSPRKYFHSATLALTALLTVGTFLCPVAVHAQAQALSATSETDRALLTATEAPANAMWVETLDLKQMSASHGEPRAGKTYDNKPLTLKGTVYPRGIGTHAYSRMSIDLKGVATRFLAAVGVDDETNGGGNAQFVIRVDGRLKADSGPMKGNDEPKVLSVDLKGAKNLVLEVNGVNGDIGNAHVDWAGALLFLAPGATEKPTARSQDIPTEAVSFPPFFPAPDKPQINGPRVVGGSPNRPFLFLIPATGKGPLSYAATGLPNGLKLDARSGIISGRLAAAGNYNVDVTVSGPAGKATRRLSIVCGDGKIALTPPMGWNAWNIWGEQVTAQNIRDAADAMISSGLAAHGFQYIVIDDTWQARRDENGNLLPNRRFGDIKALADYVHSKGLKLGIYSSPNPETCAGFSGSEGFEEKDAAAFASWGVDYLKYDWCLSGSTRRNTTADTMKAAYAKMRAALDKTDRDILLSITPYGLGDAWNWAGSIGANTWGTSTQILDRWEYVRDNGFSLHDRAQFASPGRWNDPGWLMVGKLGAGDPHFSRLTSSEQMLQVSLWSLAAAPLIISCDLTQLDPNRFYPFASALLTNPEVLEVNQDPLGKAARRVMGGGDVEVWSRPLWDGTRAVGLFNKSNNSQIVAVDWENIGLSGRQPVRDLWRRVDLGPQEETYSIDVPKHGVVLLKIGTPNANAQLP
jgi:alpha-galactosidase